MYEIHFAATSGADWAEAIELIDAETNLPTEDLADAGFELDVNDRNGRTLLTASSAAGTITRPSASQIAWRFTYSQLASLCPGTTYAVGCRFTTDTGTVALFKGSLALLDGNVS